MFVFYERYLRISYCWNLSFQLSCVCRSPFLGNEKSCMRLLLTCYCFYRLWRSTIPAFAVYSGEYGIQYLTQFGEDVICPCCFPYINFSRFLFWHSGTLLFPSNFSWSLVEVPLGGRHQIKWISSRPCWIMFVFCCSANINLHPFASFALHPSWRRARHVFHHWCCGAAGGSDSV